MALLTITASDAALVRRAVEGDAAASEALAIRYQRKAHAVAHALGIEDSSVEDVVQEAFFQAFRGLRKLRRPDAFGSWFLSIVRNIARQQLRNAPREELSPFLDSIEVSSLEDAEAKDLSRYLWHQVAKLPEGTREVIFLYYYDGESARKVAKTLGLSKAAVKYRLKKGMGLLRQRLWTELEQALRQERQQNWTKRARRLTFVALASLPLSSRANEAALAGPGSSSVPLVGVGVTGAFVMTTKAVVTAIAVVLVLATVTGFLWFELRSDRDHEELKEIAARVEPSRSGPSTIPDTDVPQVRTDSAAEDETDQEEGAPSKEWFRVVRGRVVDEEGVPIESAQVGVWNMPHSETGVLGEHPPESVARTSADGVFDVGPLDISHEYFVRVQRDGFATQCREPVRASEFLFFQLAAGSRIFGRVEAVDEKLLANRLLVIAWSTGPRTGRNYLDGCWVDPEGLFELQGVPPGKTVVFLKSKLFRTQSQRVVVETGKDHEVVFSIDEGCSFRGRLVDGVSGMAIEGAQVSVRRNRLKNTVSDSSGVFEFKGLECEQHIAQDVTAEAPGYGIRVFSANDSGEEFELFPEAILAGRVVDENRRPLNDATVVAEQFLGTGYGEDGKIVKGTRSSADGTFVIKGLFAIERLTSPRGPSLPAGSFVPGPDCVLTFRKPGYETVVVRVALFPLPADYHYELDEVALGSGIEILGRVVDDDDGAPVLGTRVFVFHGGEDTRRAVKRNGMGAILRTTTDDNGQFRGMGLSAAVSDSSNPTYVIHVSAIGYMDQTVDVTDTENEIPIRLLREGQVESRERSESEQTFDALVASGELVKDEANALSVKAKKGDVVILSGGLNRDVSLGQEYFVYRGKQYCGKIEITEVLQDLSGGRILDRRPGKRINIGDRARLVQH